MRSSGLEKQRENKNSFIHQTPPAPSQPKLPDTDKAAKPGLVGSLKVSGVSACLGAANRLFADGGGDANLGKACWRRGYRCGSTI